MLPALYFLLKVIGVLLFLGFIVAGYFVADFIGEMRDIARSIGPDEKASKRFSIWGYHE